MVCHLLSGCFDKVGVAENINIVHFLLITGDHDFGRFVKISTNSWNRKTRDAASVPFSGHPNFCTNISANGFFLSTQCKHEERQGRAQLISLYASRLKNAQKKLNSIEIAILAGLKIRVLWERIGMDLVTCNYMFSYMYLHLRKLLIFKPIFFENFEIAAVQKDANLVELEKCCQTHIFLQIFVLIQPRTRPPKICSSWMPLSPSTSKPSEYTWMTLFSDAKSRRCHPPSIVQISDEVKSLPCIGFANCDGDLCSKYESNI